METQIRSDRLSRSEAQRERRKCTTQTLTAAARFRVPRIARHQRGVLRTLCRVGCARSAIGPWTNLNRTGTSCCFRVRTPPPSPAAPRSTVLEPLHDRAGAQAGWFGEQCRDCSSPSGYVPEKPATQCEGSSTRDFDLVHGTEEMLSSRSTD
jgi:hypothetical protein